jgi:hypothetical protein
MLVRAWPVAALLGFVGLTPAVGQMPAGVGAPMGGQAPPCFNDFMPLRQDAEKKALAVRAAHERKATAQEACKLIGVFSDAEGKVVQFMEKNGAWCGIPDQVVKQAKANHEHTAELRKQICMAAANPPRAAGPTLSEALAPGTLTVPETVKPGRGTFDTLTGNALAR